MEYVDLASIKKENPKLEEKSNHRVWGIISVEKEADKYFFVAVVSKVIPWNVFRCVFY